MKINRTTIAAVAVSAFALAGCSSTDAGETSSAASDECTYTVGFSDPAGTQEVDQVYGQALAAAAPYYDMCVTYMDAGLDVNKQVQDINTFIAQEVDAIMVFPLSPGSLDAALEKAQEAGIVTIGLSALVLEEQPTAEEMGYYDALFDQNSAIGGAKQLADAFGSDLEGANVLGVGLGFPVESLQAMVSNYDRFTGEYGANWMATVENPTDDIGGAQQVVSEALTRFQGEKIDAVYAYNTSSAVGAAQALSAVGQDDAIVVGQNGDSIGVDALESGQIDAVTDLVPWRTALQLLEIASALLEGEEVAPLTFGRTIMYTQETLSERLTWEDAVAQIADGTLTCENAGCTTGDEALSAY